MGRRTPQPIPPRPLARLIDIRDRNPDHSARRVRADRLRVGGAYGKDVTGRVSGLPVLLVVVRSLGLPVHPDSHRDRFVALCREAGGPKIGIHTVRHSVARIMDENGVSPVDAAALLGHTLAVHISTHVVLMQRGVQAAGQALGEALAGAK